MDDILKNLPRNARLLFINKYVLAVEFDLKPGDILPAHETGNRIVYSLTDNRVKVTEGDRRTTNTWQQGDVHWHKAGIHPALENVGESRARYIVVSRTSETLPEVPLSGTVEELTRVVPVNATLLLDNEFVRLIDVALNTQESVPSHYEGNRIIYALTSYTVRVSDRGEESVNAWKQGDIHWHPAGEHPELENIGETSAHYLVFVFKR
jgi:quercetin dioxygenase-like cupin family protein